MFVLVKNKITEQYSCIFRRDIQSFKNLYSFFKSDPKLPEGFTPDFNFEIIEDLEDIKQILNEHFTSKGRGEEYDENLPSATKIISLYPLNLEKDKFLLRWKNNTTLVEQEGEKDLILKKGTFIHYILEQFICDKEARSKDKPLITKLKILKEAKKPSKKVIKQIDEKIISDIRKYIKMAYKDEQILYKIPDIDILKEELEYLATKCLLDFIKEELIFTDLVYSEIFLRQEDYIQGSIDLCCYNNNQFSIWDYKTTSSLDKKTGKPKFKTNSSDCLAPYARQIYIYYELLKKNGMAPPVNDYPECNVIQIHLVSGKYKRFKISKGLIQSQGKTIENVLKWYWNTRKGVKTEDFNREDEYVDEELGFITL